MSALENEGNCVTCRWWDPDSGRYELCEGQCRRHAPVRDPALQVCDHGGGHGYERPKWSHTHGSNWCGDYKARIVDEPEPEGDV